MNRPFDHTQHVHDGTHHILLAASGSVATIKLPNLIAGLNASPAPLSIRIILTVSAAQFLAGQSREQPSLADIASLPNVDGIYLDSDEWATPWTRGAPILHIELRRWADVMVIAPLSANTLAKMVAGLCDNLLLSVVRAWDCSGKLDAPHRVAYNGREKTWPGTGRKVIIVAPAMNTAMWAHPLTANHIAAIGEFNWIKVLRPVEKELACGDTGTGAMRPWNEIKDTILDVIRLEE
ncbi:phosphopantothenoylcysteine decarboxylase [Trichodelitschia bisporula]|uniref:Phosphopantothenoylcysteine decarboxylase n=1 Tax=Trichodelitschia bisporula TaxID=703511 RepID=A0A6G1I5D6_9PEZI|nr:phosphopantothenoylcysteine decarboxylase [Trichodelitschia bisporula]